METTGAFGAEPQPASPRRKPTWLERQKRTMTPEMLTRQAYIGEGLNSVMAVTQTKDRPVNESVSWYNWLTMLASAAYDTQPGSPERDKVLADALKDRSDQELARKFAALALDGLDRFLHRK
jgi:hypothetical protein